MKKTLVLGASANPARYSNIASIRLKNAGHEVIALGNRVGAINDIAITKERLDFEDIDTITLYLNAARQKDYYDYILSLKPKRIIFNPGTENPELMNIARKAGIEVVVACTLVMLSIDSY